MPSNPPPPGACKEAPRPAPPEPAASTAPAASPEWALRSLEVWGLSARERQVVHLVSQGLSSQEIAHRTLCSPSTVRSHLHGVYNKLHLCDRFEVALWAVSGADPGLPTESERRARPRFQIDQPLRYRRQDNHGSGRMLDISLGGLCFDAQAEMVPGEPLWLWITGPCGSTSGALSSSQFAARSSVARMAELPFKSRAMSSIPAQVPYGQHQKGAAPADPQRLSALFRFSASFSALNPCRFRFPK